MVYSSIDYSIGGPFYVSAALAAIGVFPKRHSPEAVGALPNITTNLADGVNYPVLRDGLPIQVVFSVQGRV